APRWLRHRLEYASTSKAGVDVLAGPALVQAKRSTSAPSHKAASPPPRTFKELKEYRLVLGTRQFANLMASTTITIEFTANSFSPDNSSPLMAIWILLGPGLWTDWDALGRRTLQVNSGAAAAALALQAFHCSDNDNTSNCNINVPPTSRRLNPLADGDLDLSELGFMDTLGHVGDRLGPVPLIRLMRSEHRRCCQFAHAPSFSLLGYHHIPEHPEPAIPTRTYAHTPSPWTLLDMVVTKLVLVPEMLWIHTRITTVLDIPRHSSLPPSDGFDVGPLLVQHESALTGDVPLLRLEDGDVGDGLCSFRSYPRRINFAVIRCPLISISTLWGCVSAWRTIPAGDGERVPGHFNSIT
ncbi:hypothetical protein BDZ89DRAFT_1050049, partial [Hymenopellis radicata]